MSMDKYQQLEERALVNYLKEVQWVQDKNFVFGPTLHPTEIMMKLDPRYHLGSASSAHAQANANNPALILGQHTGSIGGGIGNQTQQ